MKTKLSALTSIAGCFLLAACSTTFILPTDEAALARKLQNVSSNKAISEMIASEISGSSLTRIDNGYLISFDLYSTRSLIHLRQGLIRGTQCAGSLKDMRVGRYNYLFYEHFEGQKKRIGLSTPQLHPEGLPKRLDKQLQPYSHKYFWREWTGYLCAEYDDYDTVEGGRVLNPKRYFKLYLGPDQNFHLISFDRSHIKQKWLDPYIAKYQSITEEEVAARIKAREEERLQREAKQQRRQEIARQNAIRQQQQRKAKVQDLKTGMLVCQDGAVSYQTCFYTKHHRNCNTTRTRGSRTAYITNILENNFLEIRINGISNIPSKDYGAYRNPGMGQNSQLYFEGNPVTPGVITRADPLDVYSCHVY